MAGCRNSGPIGGACNQPVIDRDTTARTEHQPPGTLRTVPAVASLSMGPVRPVRDGAYVSGQIYYWDNLAALASAYERALVLAPAAITEATGFNDLGNLLEAVLKGLLAALIGLAATTALGATIGGIIGFFFGGAGAAPGAVAGAKVGFDVGIAVLTWLGLGFLVASIGQGLGELAAALSLGIQRAWEAGNNKNDGARAVEIEWAAKDLAMSIGLLIKLILEGILAYLMRGAPMATARTATGTIGRVRAGQSSAVAAETVAEVVKNLRASKLGKGFADWIELNWQKLLENPKLRRPGAAAAPASGGSSGEAQAPSQASKETESGSGQPKKEHRTPPPPPPLKTTPLQQKFVGENDPSNPNRAFYPKTVQYFSEAERANYKVTIKDGKLYDAKGKLFDTREGFTSIHSGEGKAIFVMDEQGNLYAGTHKLGEVHHSSFLAGKPVAAAGEVQVENGLLKTLSDRSGHYEPAPSFTQQALDVIKRQGVDTSKVDVVGWDGKPIPGIGK